MDFEIEVVDILCFMTFFMALLAVIQYFKTKAIYDNLIDMRRFMAGEFNVVEHKIVDLKHEVKTIEDNYVKITHAMLDFLRKIDDHEQPTSAYDSPKPLTFQTQIDSLKEYVMCLKTDTDSRLRDVFDRFERYEKHHNECMANIEEQFDVMRKVPSKKKGT